MMFGRYVIHSFLKFRRLLTFRASLFSPRSRSSFRSRTLRGNPQIRVSRNYARRLSLFFRSSQSNEFQTKRETQRKRERGDAGERKERHITHVFFSLLSSCAEWRWSRFASMHGAILAYRLVERCELSGFTRPCLGILPPLVNSTAVNAFSSRRPSLISFVARTHPSIRLSVYAYIYIYGPISCPSLLSLLSCVYSDLFFISAFIFPFLSFSSLFSFSLDLASFPLAFALSLCRFSKRHAYSCIVISWRVSLSFVFLNFIG